jgi:hypothetical protein
MPASQAGFKISAGILGCMLLLMLFGFPLPVLPQDRGRGSVPPRPIVHPLVQQLSGMAFSQDGKIGAVASQSTLILFDTTAWRARQLLTKTAVTALAFSRDGTELAMARSDCRSLSPIGEPRDRFVEISTIDTATGATVKAVTESRHISWS